MTQRRSSRRPVIQLDALETILVALLLQAAVLGGLAWAVMRGQQSVNPVQSASELEALRVRYGPNHFSEREEEWIIRDFFQDRRGGTFLDVGANHYQDASKTFYLESQLGWSGLAVEPQTQFAVGYARDGHPMLARVGKTIAAVSELLREHWPTSA